MKTEQVVKMTIVTTEKPKIQNTYDLGTHEGGKAFSKFYNW